MRWSDTQRAFLFQGPEQPLLVFHMVHKTVPDITTVRRAVRGTSFKRARVETRGAKKTLSTANLHALDRARLRLIKKADNDSEVHWEDVMRVSTRQLQDNSFPWPFWNFRTGFP